MMQEIISVECVVRISFRCMIEEAWRTMRETKLSPFDHVSRHFMHVPLEVLTLFSDACLAVVHPEDAFVSRKKPI